MRRLVAVAVSVVGLVFAGESAAFAGQSVHGPPFPTSARSKVASH